MFSKEFKEATYIQQQPTANNFKNKVAIKTFWLFKILRAIETKKESQYDNEKNDMKRSQRILFSGTG